MKFAEKLSIPKDIASGLPIVTITGKQELYVENYQGIISYENHCIKVQTKYGRITFAGSDFMIVYYTNNDMKITGELESITYS